MDLGKAAETMMDDGRRTGYFIFSLDTELGTGFFDLDEERKRLFSPDGFHEREKVRRLLALLDEYQILATWAVVGHIFYERCEECEICPILEWKGKYSSFEEAYRTNHPLWYGADVIDMLLNQKLKHEIAFHGYSHEIFDERRMSREKAEVEIKEYIRVANRRGIEARSVVFPRDKVGHLDLFEKYGFVSYRSEESLPLIIRNKYFVGKILKTADHILGITTPPVYDPSEFGNGNLVNLRATQHIFGFNRHVELILDAWNLPLLRVRRIIKAIKKAAVQKKVVHVWAHPWEFRTEQDFDKLRYIFQHVAQEVSAGNMQSVTMNEMAQIVTQIYGN